MSTLARAPLPMERQRGAQGFPKALSTLAKCEHTPLDADFLLFKCTFWQRVPSRQSLVSHPCLCLLFT